MPLSHSSSAQYNCKIVSNQFEEYTKIISPHSTQALAAEAGVFQTFRGGDLQQNMVLKERRR